MKKTAQTTVRWQYQTEIAAGYPDLRVFLQDKHDRVWVLKSLEISSLLDTHPAGRCVSIVIYVANPPHGIRTMTHEILSTKWGCSTDEAQQRDREELGYLRLTSSSFGGVIGRDDRAHSVQWKLRQNETFLDGAVRIGIEILTKTGATGHGDHFSRQWMFAHFEVTQRTFFKSPALGQNPTGDWQPIENYLIRRHGLR